MVSSRVRDYAGLEAFASSALGNPEKGWPVHEFFERVGIQGAPAGKVGREIIWREARLGEFQHPARHGGRSLSDYLGYNRILGGLLRDGDEPEEYRAVALRTWEGQGKKRSLADAMHEVVMTGLWVCLASLNVAAQVGHDQRREILREVRKFAWALGVETQGRVVW